jgi:hypothetical protein
VNEVLKYDRDGIGPEKDVVLRNGRVEYGNKKMDLIIHRLVKDGT